jgi:fatty acid desaturase
MPAAADAHGAYAALRRAVVAAGLLERAYVYYAWRAAISLAMLFAGPGIAHLGPPWPATMAVAAVLLAFGSVQVGLVGHDAGHLAVFRERRPNVMLGWLCWSVCLGISFWYWDDRHRRHHASTNDLVGDPDLQGSNVVPLYALALPFAFRLESWKYALRELHGVRRATELAVLLASTLAWLAPVTVLGGGWIVIFVCGQFLAGLYLSLAIAPNHVGMPVWPAGAAVSFLDRQVLSSRNVAPNRVWDFVFGGLNYQIEHHLFPTMPRKHLGRARKLVKPFCAARGLPYTEMGALACYRVVFSELRRERAPARA